MPGSVSDGVVLRTEFETVVIQDDVCNGCGYCVPACPFGVPQLNPRMVDSPELAPSATTGCAAGLLRLPATACPTAGDPLRTGGRAETSGSGPGRYTLKQSGSAVGPGCLGDDELGGTGGIKGLNAMFVLNGPPDAFNLPSSPVARLEYFTRRGGDRVVAAGYAVLAAAFSLRRRG